MTQAHLIVLLLKVVLVAGAASIAAFTAVYTRYAPWWKDPVGRTIIIESVLLLCCITPTTLSLFFSFSRLTSNIAAWADIVLFGLLTPVMLWRCVVWHRLHRLGVAATTREPVPPERI